MDKVMKLASQRAVVVFSLSSCCMCHTVLSLFHDLGVNATIHELDEDPRGREMERALTRLVGRNPPVPVVFIGGKLVGSTDRIMSLHVGGKLVPLLHEAVSREFKPYFFLNLREVDGQLLCDPILVRLLDIDQCNLAAQVFPPTLTLLHKSFHQLYLLRTEVSKLHLLGGERRTGGRRRRGEQVGGEAEKVGF
ncbi:hypothetical protein C4D60_Mb11t16130 [Musa balbisiana]|uniref:Glutaredoxin domain-containing protein n=1 Tax=Musa balbisiana TaxID=52838 RepID=A0A4S8J4H4_MUSBA|nr:hypothetical protein C4D60_Mb11t16130 [Musa balbisiana]